MTSSGRLVVVLGLVVLMTAGGTGAGDVLVVGLDGADWSVIRPMVEDGRLPHLAGLMEDGQHGPLTSTLPLESPVAWTSMTTGTDPGAHGIHGFVELTPQGTRPLDADDVQVPRVWDRLEGDSVVINVPQTHPPADINGSLVSSYLATEGSNYTSPPGLQDELEEMGYRTEVLEDSFEAGDEEAFLGALNRTVSARTRAAEHLLDEGDPQLGFVVYTGLDRLQHYFWDDHLQPGSEHHTAVRDQYERLDAELGRLLERTDDSTTVLVVSDHGFSRLTSYVYLNSWLRQQGYIELDTGEGSGGGLLRRIGLTQESVVGVLSGLGLLDPVTTVLDRLGLEPGSRLPTGELGDIDLEASEAYAGNYGGRIHIDVDDPERYREVRSAIIDGLEDLRHPESGEKVFDAVLRAEEAYAEPGTGAPDLVIDPAPGYRAVGFIGHRSVFGRPPHKTGTHARDGIYVLSGPGVGSGRRNASILDIAPTILAAAGQGPPDAMHGTALIDRE